FYNPEIFDSHIINQYTVSDSPTWKIGIVRKKAKFDESMLSSIEYRPFDKRWIYFDKNLIDRHRSDVMHNFIKIDNLGLCFNRQIEQQRPFTDVFIVQNIITNHSVSLKENNTIAPLYIYPTAQDLLSTGERQPNFNAEIIKTFAKKLKLTFTPEKQSTTGTFAPIDVLDYIYAVLHSPNYRNTYKEFLKTDFPRVPYPQNVNSFWSLVNIGSQIRQLHLLQSDSLKQSPVTYPQAGDNKITRKIVQKDWQLLADSSTVGRIYINEQQYFDNIPLIAWEFYIGGYQPAQKWLKDRTGRQLSTADIQHYRKMIKALIETARLMQEVDTLLVL
ncbi:type ISP restriction/modification enzyme, partial [uncultured Agitococcus sp.]|uniref:type ISP restriction/modification enzyme n=1 Tax=uncultured Agitococcus sp. TaxID=1506599 RepID=UPI00345C50EA